MEIWIDPATKRIMATYDPGKYTGSVWPDKGYVAYNKLESWMLPKKPLPPEPPQATEIQGDDGKTYVVRGGMLVIKPEPVPI